MIARELAVAQEVATELGRVLNAYDRCIAELEEAKRSATLLLLRLDHDRLFEAEGGE